MFQRSVLLLCLMLTLSHFLYLLQLLSITNNFVLIMGSIFNLSQQNKKNKKSYFKSLMHVPVVCSLISIITKSSLLSFKELQVHTLLLNLPFNIGPCTEYY